MIPIVPESSADRSRRDEILAAALHCFLEKGYDATTIQDIRAESGASTGSIYHAFSGKDAIAAELLVDTIDDWQTTLLARLDRERDAEGVVRAAVDHYVAWVARAPDRARFLLHAPRARLEAQARGRIQAKNVEFLRALRARVKPHLASLRPIPPDLLVPIVIGPAMEWARQWLGRGAKSGPTEARRVLADAAWASVRRR
jgi:AcrR family transcriptional regulator